MLHDRPLGTGQIGFRVRQHETEERGGFAQVENLSKSCRIDFLQLFQSAADSVPARQIVPGLGPAENPWNCAKIGQRPLSRAATWPGPDTTQFQGINRGRRTEEVDESFHFKQAAVRSA